jgi:hypothetical protein
VALRFSLLDGTDAKPQAAGRTVQVALKRGSCASDAQQSAVARLPGSIFDDSIFTRPKGMT